MNQEKLSASEIKKEIENITREGIQADRPRLKKDMCAQFADPREWIREYVVNAFDAHARTCRISGYEDKDTITIVIEDDGYGMDRKGVKDFNTIYRSIKKGDTRRVIGSHGIGKLSIAAIPGQCGFIMITSTGEECWRMQAGCLLNEEPIRLERIEPVPLQGTRFEVTFRKTVSLRRELRELGNILERYVKYLPLAVIVFEPTGDSSDSPETPRLINGSWVMQRERFCRMYSFKLDGKEYHVVMGLWTASHEIYQNLVLVTNRYNLLSHDLTEKLEVPYLKIRVNSPDFELPFGRHCLRNEEILSPLSRHLREHIFSQYFDELCMHYEEGSLSEYDISPNMVEDMACSLIKHNAGADRRWCGLPVFEARNRPRISFRELKYIAGERGVLYLESEDNMGVDYSIFDIPVLARKQPTGGVELLKTIFKKELVNLSLNDVVMEIPAGTGPTLGPIEKYFQKFLGFHPEAILRSRQRVQENRGGTRPDNYHLSQEKLERLHGVCEESMEAMHDLERIKWRVNYLVERDGKTPCTTHRFLLTNNTVILNLNYSEVRQLLLLSGSAPALAGHWALAMCLANENRILPHLTPEAREDLILLDAMAKCGSAELPEDMPEIQSGVSRDNRRQDFLRNIDDTDWGLN